MSDERDDWDALLHSAGWQRLLVYAKAQWGGTAYKAKVKQAISAHPDNCGPAIQVIDTVSDEINILLTHPAQRLAAMAKAAEIPEPHPSRRGTL